MTIIPFAARTGYVTFCTRGGGYNIRDANRLRDNIECLYSFAMRERTVQKEGKEVVCVLSRDLCGKALPWTPNYSVKIFAFVEDLYLTGCTRRIIGD